MRDLLFLAHRIPYPPDKGDKIRAWNVLRHLAERYRVHLVTFIDNPDDIYHVEALERVCSSVVWRPLRPTLAKLRSLRCLLTGAPLTQGYFGDDGLRDVINGIIERHRPSLLYVFSSAMAAYIPHSLSARLILDMVDVDSEKWRQYAIDSSGLSRLVYARESRALLAVERWAAAIAEAVLFVSYTEAALFTRLAPEAADHTYVVSNGVDAEFFNPALDFADPFDGRSTLVFTGAMDYRPNIDAMRWFVDQVMPQLRKHPARPSLWIVGANPSREVLALAGPDIRITGRVPDVRPYLRHAKVVVAPLRIARGIQNKVLEAMAMAVAVVVTPQAREGLDGCRGDEIVTAVDAQDFAAAVARILEGDGSWIGGRARDRVIRDFSWGANLQILDRLLEDKPTVRQEPRSVLNMVPAPAGGLNAQ